MLNLATGFDTRPYRLDIPAATEWTEADLPEIIREKERLLAGETARCRLSRVAVDLADAPSRHAVLNGADGLSEVATSLVGQGRAILDSLRNRLDGHRGEDDYADAPQLNPSAGQ